MYFNCRLCGRALRSEESQKVGYGPVCAKKVLEEGMLHLQDKHEYIKEEIVYCLFNMGDDQGALSILNDALKENQGFAEAYFYRAAIYEKQGDVPQALLDISKAIEYNPNRVEFYISRGNTYNKQGKLIEALADYNKVVELDPNYATAYDNLAVTYYQLKQYDKAWVNLRKLEQLGSYSAERISMLKRALNQVK